MNFAHLHQQPEPLIIANVWDAASAAIAEKTGYSAMGTSSAAIAHSKGLEDGETIPFDALINIVKEIKRTVSLPLTVDIEGGYSRDPQQVVGNIARLSQHSVVGINIEDSLVDDDRKLTDAAQFADYLHAITRSLREQHIEMFVNVRTDAFLVDLSDPVAETQHRIRLYEAAGANGIFVPGIVREPDIKAITATTDLPINVMCMPDLPDFNRLQELGVKRISMGNFVHEYMLSMLQQQLSRIWEQQSFTSVFAT